MRRLPPEPVPMSEMASGNTAGSVDEYISDLPAEAQAALETVRALVRAEIPEVVERISYGMPTFDFGGKWPIYFAGWKKHISFYPVTRAMDDAFAGEIEPYRSGKGTLKFPLRTPLPVGLIRRLIGVAADEARRGNA